MIAATIGRIRPMLATLVNRSRAGRGPGRGYALTSPVRSRADQPRALPR